ncbi:transposase [Chloroflexota bacterium]
MIKSEIVDVIKRFPSAKQLYSYAGLIPSTCASGEYVLPWRYYQARFKMVTLNIN